MKIMKKGCEVKSSSSLASRSRSLICPLCEAGKLKPSGQDSTPGGSYFCAAPVSGAMLGALRHIVDPAGCPWKARLRGVRPSRDAPPARRDVSLPGLPLGVAPQRRLFDPFGARGARPSVTGQAEVDGRFGERGNFVDNPNLARWEDPSERLDYYPRPPRGQWSPPAQE